MKKSLACIFLALLAFSPHLLISQEKFPLKLGLKAAPNLAWMNPNTSGYSSDGIRVGCTIGFISDFYFAENYSLSSGINFQFLNGKLHYTDSLLHPQTGERIHEDILRSYNLLYLEIPIMIKMKTKKFGDVAYFGQIGIGTGFRVKATFTDELDPAIPGSDDSGDYSEYTTLIRESVLFGLGCEYYLDESSRILLGISYSNGLNNILTGVNYSTGLQEKSLLNYVELNIGFIF